MCTYFVISLTDILSDIYALCEAFPESFADKLYKETEKLLQKFVGQLQHVSQCFKLIPVF